jgi:hypothetical protein
MFNGSPLFFSSHVLAGGLESVTMYKKLLPLVNRFVYLRQGYFNRYYEGKLLEVTPDTVTMQSYDDTGKPEAEWIIAITTVTEFMTGDRDLDELNMRVSMAKTLEQAELNDDSYRLILNNGTDVAASSASVGLLDHPFMNTAIAHVSDAEEPPMTGRG